MVNKFNPSSPNYIADQDDYGVDYRSQIPTIHQDMTEIIRNIVSQIDPKVVLKDLRRSLRGETQDAAGVWVQTSHPLVNSACEYDIMVFLNSILSNNTVMSTMSENEIGNTMGCIIETITRMFTSNLEKYGFVEPGPGFANGVFDNKGIPDSSRMTQVSNLIYMVCYLTLKRSINGMESRKVFGSLSMNDQMSFDQQQQQQNPGFFGRMLGRR